MKPSPEQSIDEKDEAVLATDARISVDASSSGCSEDQKLGKTGILVFVALCCALFLAALDLGAVGTAAPSIVHDLHGGDFTWVGAAYALSSAACLPLSGNLADIFGRKYVLLSALLIFAVGSAITASAPSMTVLIVGRAIQGVGGGGIQSLTAIVTADLIPLRKRGIYTSITGMMWTLGSVSGPFIAGALSEKASWRWLFYINLPLCAIALLIVTLFLDVHKPEGHFLAKLGHVDWIGNVLIISSTTSCMIGLTWGGIRYSWASFHVLVPLIVGILGLIASPFYEAHFPSKPTIKPILLTNRTTVIGLAVTALHSVVIMSVAYYLPTWFQAVRGASPIQSGLLLLPMCIVISPSAIVQGLIVAKTGRYKPVILVSWCIGLIALGVFTILRRTTPVALLIVIQMIFALFAGLLYASTFSVLAPLPESENASAISLLTFTRLFSQAWGIAIGGTILQNGLQSRLPSTVLDQFAGNSDGLAYTIIPLIPNMDASTQVVAKDAFVHALRLVWIVMLALSGLGMLLALLVDEVSLRKTTDGKWGMRGKKEPHSEPSPLSTSV